MSDIDARVSNGIARLCAAPMQTEIVSHFVYSRQLEINQHFSLQAVHKTHIILFHRRMTKFRFIIAVYE